MKSILLAVALLCCAAPAAAQTLDPIPPGATLEVVPPAPVETLTCEQMQAEMIVAGQLMQSQMDPNFAANVQEMQDESQRRMSAARAGMVGTGVVCAIPGLGMACTAAANAMAASQMAHADEDRARRDRLIGGIQSSMVGIDMDRATAINARWQSQGCQMPPPPQMEPQQ